LQHAPVRVHGPQHLDRLVDIVRQGLLAVDVLAGAEGRQRDDGVPVVGRGDADGLNILAVDDLAEVVVGRTRGLRPGPLTVELIDARLGRGAARGIHVADRQDPRLLPQEAAQQAAALRPNADEAHRQPRIRLGIRRPNVRRQNDRGHGRREGGPLQ
jgi:hypothetical protein